MLTRRRPSGMLGMSLIEMVIAMAIVSVLFAMGAPSFFTWVAGLQLRAAAEGIMSGLQLARTEAAKRNQQVDFTIVSTSGAGWSVTLTADGTVIQTRSSAESNPSVRVTATPAVGVITFNNLGQRVVPAAVVGTVTLAMDNAHAGDCQPAGSIRCMNIQIPVGGQIKMCDPALPSSDPRGC